nr:leucine-rich repeat domain-containing protein [uncultured Hyphomonas sp.]
MTDPNGPPEGLFLDELEAVADEARDLAEHLRAPNYLPTGFPKDDVRLLCTALQGLSRGTTLAAVETLDYARKRIVIWRREYFPAKRPHENIQDLDKPPTQDRHGLLDNKLTKILAGVSTAISTYEEVTGKVVKLDVRPEQAVTPEEEQSTELHGLSEKAVDTVADIEELENQARADESSEIQKTVGLPLHDLKTRAQIAAVETAQKRPQLSLLTKVSRGLRYAASTVWDICCNADKDLAPLAKAWGEWNKAQLQSILEQVRIVSTGIDQSVRNIRERRAAANSPIDDKTLEQWEFEAIISLLTGQAIPIARRPYLRYLFIDASDEGLFEALKSAGAPLDKIYADQEADRWQRRIVFSNLAPLAELTSLQTLYLSRTQVSDLTPLAELKSLDSLFLANTQVSDLTPLAQLTSMHSLDCANTQVSDLTPLAQLTSMHSLNLSNTQVSDLTPLAELKSLDSLFLANTQVSDLTPLTQLTSLDSLYLDGTQVSDLTPLAQLTSLNSLDLDNTQVSDLTPLAELKSLDSLFLNRTQVSDLTPLAELKSLDSLYLDGAQVSDLTPLAQLTSLNSLDLDNTQVSDLTSLAQLTSIHSLNLSNTQVSDLTPLAELKSLDSLFLTNTQVSDLTPLAQLISLDSLDCTNTQVSDLTPLANLANLRLLYFDNTQISDLTPLASLTNLHSLYLDSTQISNLSPLTQLTSLYLLYLDGAQVSDWSPVDHVDIVYGRPVDWPREPRR